MRVRAAAGFAGALMIAGLVAFALVVGAPAPATDVERAARVDAMYRDYRTSFPDVPEVLPLALSERLAGDQAPVLVDVREANEQAISLLPGAITRAEYEVAPERFAGREVVTYCTIGYRSGLYAAELRGRGVNASNLAGSILAWTHAGLPVVDKSGQPTKYLHVFGAHWDLAPLAYQATW